MLEGSQNTWTRREVCLFVFPCTLNPLWIPLVLSVPQCCGSRRSSSDSHVAAREKPLCTQGRAPCLLSPRSFKLYVNSGSDVSYLWALPVSHLRSLLTAPFCAGRSMLSQGKILQVLLRERSRTSARRQQRDGFTIQKGREGGETALECSHTLPRRSCCRGTGKELTLFGS